LTSYVNAGGSVVSGVFLWNLYASGYNHSGTTAFNVTNTQSNVASPAAFTVSTPSVITNGIGTNFGELVLTNSNPTLSSGASLYASYDSGSVRLLAVKEVGNSKLISVNASFTNINTSGETLTKMVGNSILFAGGKLIQPTSTPTPTTTPTNTGTPTTTPTPSGTPAPTIQSFTSVGTTSWTAPAGVTSVEYLVVGGGGGAGNGYDSGGGGGAGGGMVLTGITSVIPGNSYTITVGSGGTGGADTRTNNNGTDGNSSVFGSITALGGGYGGGSRTNNPGPAGTGQGLGGATQVTNVSSGVGGNGGGGGNAGGGGGGAAGAGTNRVSAASAGVGGAGITSSITGAAVVYGGGGNGGTANNGTINGANGSANTGKGGGAGSSNGTDSSSGGNGGSGIVVLKYFT
jgi:hypothetical protein